MHVHVPANQPTNQPTSRQHFCFLRWRKPLILLFTYLLIQAQARQPSSSSLLPASLAVYQSPFPRRPTIAVETGGTGENGGRSPRISRQRSVAGWHTHPPTRFVRTYIEWKVFASEPHNEVGFPSSLVSVVSIDISVLVSVRC